MPPGPRNTPKPKTPNRGGVPKSWKTQGTIPISTRTKYGALNISPANEVNGTSLARQAFNAGISPANEVNGISYAAQRRLGMDAGISPANEVNGTALGHPLYGNSSGVTSRGGKLPTNSPGSSSAASAEVVDPGYQDVTADLTKNPYPGPYDKLMEYVKTNAASRAGEYDATKATLQAQQEAANKDMYNAYLGSRTGADASATALGVDPALASAARDLAMRKSQENSDQSLADNLAWVDKSKLLKGDALQATEASLGNDKLQRSTNWDIMEKNRVDNLNVAGKLAYAQAAADKLAATGKGGKGGGGGGKKGGKGGGGSSSSSGIKGTSTQTDTMYNSGLDLAAYNEMIGEGDQEGAALLKNATNLQGPDQSVVKYLQAMVNDETKSGQYNKPVYTKPKAGDKNAIANLVVKAFTEANKEKAAKAAKLRAATAQRALSKAEKYSGYLGTSRSASVNKASAKGPLT